MDIWKSVSLWNQSRLGNIKAPGSYCIAAPGADRDGRVRIDIHSVSDIDYSGNYCIDSIQNVI